MAKKELTRLLVIEDNPSHLAEARAFFSGVSGLETQYVETLHDALGEHGWGGRIYEEGASNDNPKWYDRVSQFKKEEGIPVDSSKLTEEHIQRIQAYGTQLEEQGIPRLIVGERTILVDGVITDLFFPMGRRTRVEELDNAPNGLIVGATCQRVGVPYVICTAGYHHGRKYEWANQMNRAMGAPDMIDSYTPGNNEAEAEHKNWKSAFAMLKQIVEKQ